MRNRPTILPGLLAALACVVLAPALAANDATGQWEGPFLWPNQGTHMAHLYTGKILMWPGHYDTSDSIEAWLWDASNPQCFEDNPASDFDPNCFEQIDNQETNLFCSGHAQTGDGQILITGGHTEFTGANVGLPDANIFDPATETWSGADAGVAKMEYRRWYPTSTTLPDGTVLTVSGSDSVCRNGDEDGHPCERNSDCGNHGRCELDGGGWECNGGPLNGAACNDGFDQTTCLDPEDDARCDDTLLISRPEVYDPKTQSWDTLNTAVLAMPFYPFIFVLPDGDVFYAGAEDEYAGQFSPVISTRTSYTLDLETETWTPIAGPMSSSKGGSAVMFEPGKVLKAGGGFTPSSPSADIIDMTSGGDKQWHPIGSMQAGRVRNNLTLLADGTVLATGGTRFNNREFFNVCDNGDHDGQECRRYCNGDTDQPRCSYQTPCANDDPCVHACPGGTCKSVCVGGDNLPCDDNDDCVNGGTCVGGQAWVAEAELIDPRDFDPDNPAATTWQTMDSMSIPRMYHSTALLLPDGRVIQAGGGQGGDGINSYKNFEIFSPPYLFDGDQLASRPTIGLAPDALRYGDFFHLQTADAAEVASVALVRLGAATHGNDQDQRYVPLTFAKQDGQLRVRTPNGPTLAPPGYYMLFLVNDAGTPAVAKYVRMLPVTAVWVDFNYGGFFQVGTFELPFDSLEKGIAAVKPGGVVRVKDGANMESPLAVTKPMTIESFEGSATVN